MPQRIAKLVIEGTIEKENDTYKQEWLLETIKELQDKKNVTGIMLYINSPGGGVYESDEVYQALLSYKENSGRPVYAYLSSLAASGGYYIACAADKIIANRNTLTGSIGVIAGHFFDLTELMKKYGMKSETIHAGRNKTMGSFTEPVTEEQRQIMQSIADECYDQFTQIVAESRHLDIASVRELADGRIYTASQAKKLGLVDEIATFDEAAKIFKENVLNDKEADAETKEYKLKPKRNLLKMLKEASTSTSLPETATKLIGNGIMKTHVPFPAYYCGIRDM